MTNAPKPADIRGLKVVASGDMPTMYLYEEIGPGWMGMIDDNAVLAGLLELGDAPEINVRINSPGGVVDIGSTIYNLLVEHPAKIHVRVDGVAASIASVIMMAGDTITVSANSRVMIHNASTWARGNKQFMRDTALMLEKADAAIVETYATRTKKSAADIIAWMDAETWFTADEAITAGFATDKYQPIKGIAMRVPKDLYKHAPKDLTEYVREIPGVTLRKPPADEPEPIRDRNGAGYSVSAVAARLARAKARI